jgi:hypothetical protein
MVEFALQWEASWLMAFHPEKNVLTITKKRNPTKFNSTLHGHSLEDVTSAKYIGCTITSDSWGLGLSLGVFTLPIAPVSYLMTLLQ